MYFLILNNSWLQYETVQIPSHFFIFGEKLYIFISELAIKTQHIWFLNVMIIINKLLNCIKVAWFYGLFDVFFRLVFYFWVKLKNFIQKLQIILLLHLNWQQHLDLKKVLNIKKLKFHIELTLYLILAKFKSIFRNIKNVNTKDIILLKFNYLKERSKL